MKLTSISPPLSYTSSFLAAEKTLLATRTTRTYEILTSWCRKEVEQCWYSFYIQWLLELSSCLIFLYFSFWCTSFSYVVYRCLSTSVHNRCRCLNPSLKRGAYVLSNRPHGLYIPLKMPLNLTFNTAPLSQNKFDDKVVHVTIIKLKYL